MYTGLTGKGGDPGTCKSQIFLSSTNGGIGLKAAEILYKFIMVEILESLKLYTCKASKALWIFSPFLITHFLFTLCCVGEIFPLLPFARKPV